MSYFERLQQLWADPATHNVAVALALLWLDMRRRLNALAPRVQRLEREVFPDDSKPPALQLANRR